MICKTINNSKVDDSNISFKHWKMTGWGFYCAIEPKTQQTQEQKKTWSFLWPLKKGSLGFWPCFTENDLSSTKRGKRPKRPKRPVSIQAHKNWKISQMRWLKWCWGHVWPLSWARFAPDQAWLVAGLGLDFEWNSGTNLWCPKHSRAQNLQWSWQES